MKKRICICMLLSLLLCLCLCSCTDGSGAVLTETWDAQPLRAWLEAEVLPHLAAVVTILGVALVELLPAIRGLCKAKGAFSKVAADVDAYNKSKIEYDMRAEKREERFEARMERMRKEYNAAADELRELVNTYEARLSESEGRLSEKLTALLQRAERTERMVYIGMSNAGELVVNGAARQIARIEGEEVETDADENGGEHSP